MLLKFCFFFIPQIFSKSFLQQHFILGPQKNFSKSGSQIQRLGSTAFDHLFEAYIKTDFYVFVAGWKCSSFFALITKDAVSLKLSCRHSISIFGNVRKNMQKAFSFLCPQVCLSYFAPGLSHNHVHFVFPSAMCVFSKKLLNHEGTLYKLLSPHFRFTERINYQVKEAGQLFSLLRCRG